MHEPEEHLPLHTSPEWGRPFHQHLDSLFRFAQVLTLDETRAAKLVEQACRRAIHVLPAGISADQERLQLYQLITALHREVASESAADNLVDASLRPGAEKLAEENIPNYRRRVAEQVLERIVPVAVAGLPDDLRALLLLCDVEGMACERAAEVLGMEADLACSRLEEAHRRMHEAVYSGATDDERQLLAASLPPDRARTLLGHVLRNEFTSMPVALRASGEDSDAEVSSSVAADGPGVESEDLSGQPLAVGARSNRTSRARGVLVALVVVLVTGLAAYFVSRQVSRGNEQDLVSLAAQMAGDVRIDMETASPEEAERYVQDRFGLRLTLPEIDQAPLRGVSITEVTQGVKMPVFHYEDETTGEPLILFAYSYALLDRNRGRVTIAKDILNQIEDDKHFDLHDLGTEKVLVWRNRDDIFVAVARSNAGELTGRIIFPS